MAHLKNYVVKKKLNIEKWRCEGKGIATSSPGDNDVVLKRSLRINVQMLKLESELVPSNKTQVSKRIKPQAAMIPHHSATSSAPVMKMPALFHLKKERQSKRGQRKKRDDEW